MVTDKLVDSLQFVSQDAIKAIKTYSQLSAIRVNPNGLNRFLAFCFYAQIIRTQLQ
ncbi:uncharacterized protein BX663DRAFT_509066 [Cokeromyces recurvatus]|uniref:uncharacterized protein n=1 Tax=Cokeromyces recurvatus TaxID=90255 RepID=UPI00221E8FAA|nr:uncharacterized protein BX663DRAFT_509066 [Cokeromyces recurvatus]KAI7902975.1 hypothetical protein BX663DRAFT_509066 [Cokeromyces recurvatus]